MVYETDAPTLPRKQFWSKLVKNAILGYWTNMLRDEAQRMSTLIYLKLDATTLGSPHSIWKELHNKPDIRKASIKAKLLVQRYPLSGSHTAGEGRTPKCTLCNLEEEATTHFLLYCPTLHQARQLYLPRILDVIRRYRVDVDPVNIVAILLDANNLPANVPSSDLASCKTLCTDLVYKLHNNRSILLGGISEYKTCTTAARMSHACCRIIVRI